MKSRPYPEIPLDRRRRAEAAWNADAPVADVARILHVRKTSLHNFVRRWGWAPRMRANRSIRRGPTLRRCPDAPDGCGQLTPATERCRHCGAPWIRKAARH